MNKGRYMSTNINITLFHEEKKKCTKTMYVIPLSIGMYKIVQIGTCNIIKVPIVICA